MTANACALLHNAMIISVQKLIQSIKSLLVSEDVKCHCSLLADFKKGDKNVKTFSKGEQILLLLRNFYRKIGIKLMISYSNKIQPLLNASRA